MLLPVRMLTLSNTSNKQLPVSCQPEFHKIEGSRIQGLKDSSGHFGVGIGIGIEREPNEPNEPNKPNKPNELKLLESYEAMKLPTAASPFVIPEKSGIHCHRLTRTHTE